METKAKWYTSFLTPQTVFLICGGIVWAVIFWIRTEDSWKDINSVQKDIKNMKEEKAGLIEFNELKAQVQRQYGTQREYNEKQDKDVDELKLWKAFKEGQESILEKTKK